MEGVWAANLAMGASVLLAGVALLLALVGFVSYKRVGHGRLLWVALAFVGFLAQGILLTLHAFERRADIAAGTAPEVLMVALLNLAIVGCLYLAVLKR